MVSYWRNKTQYEHTDNAESPSAWVKMVPNVSEASSLFFPFCLFKYIQLEILCTSSIMHQLFCLVFVIKISKKAHKKCKVNGCSVGSFFHQETNKTATKKKKTPLWVEAMWWAGRMQDLGGLGSCCKLSLQEVVVILVLVVKGGGGGSFKVLHVWPRFTSPPGWEPYC